MSRPELLRQLTQGARQLGVALSLSQQEQLLDFLDLLRRWSRVYNLTSITDPPEMVAKHLLDALSVAPHMVGDRCLDLGTGAGLPGLVLAICDPQKHWTLLDGNGKKTRFCVQAVAQLALQNVAVVHARIDEYQPVNLYDTIVARALMAAPELQRLASGMLTANGRVVHMKGRYPEEELKALQAMPVALDVHAISVPGVLAERHVLICQSG